MDFKIYRNTLWMKGSPEEGIPGKTEGTMQRGEVRTDQEEEGHRNHNCERWCNHVRLHVRNICGATRNLRFSRRSQKIWIAFGLNIWKTSAHLFFKFTVVSEARNGVSSNDVTA